MARDPLQEFREAQAADERARAEQSRVRARGPATKAGRTVAAEARTEPPPDAPNRDDLRATPAEEDFPFTAEEEARTASRGVFDDGDRFEGVGLGDPEDDAPPDAPDLDLPDIGPLGEAAGKAVELESFLSGAGGPGVSETLAAALRRALDYPAAPEVEGVRLITPLAYLAAAFEEPSTKEERDWSTAQEALFDWAISRPEGFADDPALRPDPTRPAPARAALAPELTDAVIRAARIVRVTHRRQSRIDSRHLLTALAGMPAGAQAAADTGLLRPDPVAGLAEMRDRLAEQVLGQLARFEDRDVWRGLFDAIDPAALAAGLRADAPAPAPLPDYRSDDVARARAPGEWLASDRLGVAADARAFADLICLEDARPPLAIGLFGAWGAGKSTFMRMIQDGIEANRAVSARLAAAGAPAPFVRNVVHVWFNAWHYLDANLWASLVSHIFRELDRQSRETPRDFLREAQLGALVRKLATAETMEREATETAEARRREVADARARLAKLEDDRAAQLRRLAKAAPDMLDAKAKAALDRALTAIGAKSAAASLADLGALAEEGRSLGGRLGLVLGSLTTGPRAGWSLAAGLALLAGGVAGAAWLPGAGLPAGLAEIGASVATGLGAVAGAVAWLGPHLARVNAALKPVFEAEAKARAEREAARAELARLEAKQAAEERDLAQAREDLSGLRALARGERPAELLAHFIEDRAGGEGYRRHLGLLSRIRDDFELMSTLMRDRAAAPDAGGDLPGFERIVLYIDDLDRCRDEQVVEVLEAIHLLLAFDLFVVVVGVDSRWIEGALGRYYRRQLARGGAAGGGGTAGPAGDDRPSVADYLEKIFQAPFRLRPLDFGEGGGYARLVDDLVGDLAPEPAREGWQGPPAGEMPPPPGSDPLPAPPAPPALETFDLSPPEREETAADLYARLRLTARERDAIAALGPVVGGSPRKVKRFVNLYRLMRARRRGAALDAFLGEPEGAAPFRMALIWLAIETGLGPEAARRFAAAMRAADFWDASGVSRGVDAPDWRCPTPDPETPEDDPQARRIAWTRRRFWQAVPERRMREALARQLWTTRGLREDEVRDMALEAERFSLRGDEDLFEGRDRDAVDAAG